MSGSLGSLWSTFREDFPYSLDLPQPARALGVPLPPGSPQRVPLLPLTPDLTGLWQHPLACHSLGGGIGRCRWACRARGEGQV